MATDEIKGLARFFYVLGFPAGIISAAGCFSFALGLWRGEVDFGNKRLILGAFLFVTGVFLQHLPNVFGFYLIDRDEAHGLGRIRTYFSFRNFVGVLVYGFLVYKSGRLLWLLLHS